MLDPKEFYNFLNSIGINFFTGVPDSLLKSFCGFVADNADTQHHVIAANEGGAVATGIGYHLATGNVPMIYMQNSGLGNAINPLISLADREVYSIPMIILIGWRGEPDFHDEPQHIKQGKIMLSMIDSMKLPCKILTGNFDEDKEIVRLLTKEAIRNQTPVFLVARKGLFKPYQFSSQEQFDQIDNLPTRENLIIEILKALPKDTLVVSTTGMASREIYEIRDSNQAGHHLDFLTVGGMGHASQIAFGLSLHTDKKNIVCIDGDGAALMHLGSMAISGQFAKENFKHILLNNGAHDSVGGQPTVGFKIDFNNIANSFGYKCIENEGNDVTILIKKIINAQGPVFLELKSSLGSRKDLGRPSSTPQENKMLFMQNFKK
ncbi:phosphonopyruvate decarboxylase [bacterium]|nr:phosphonopyruvate decarboxylase [bacterium]